MKNKKYMIITRALTHGGAEKTAANLATALSKKREVILVTINSDRTTYEVDTQVISLNMPIHNKGNKLIWYYQLIRKISKLKKEYNITCTISFLMEPDIANVFSRGNDMRVISIRNKQSALFKGILRKIRDKMIFLKSDKIVAISRMVKEDLLNNYSVSSRKVEVIYNFSNRHAITNIMINDDLIVPHVEFNKDLVAINVGRLTYQKGQWHLIRAFKSVIKRLPNAKLIILGEGELYDYLNKLIIDLEMSNNIFLLGYKKNPYEYIHNSDLFVFSSLFEGLGNSIVESLVCDTPVISTDCDSGPRELLCPETNVLETGTAKEIIYGNYGVLVPCLDGKMYGVDIPLTQEEENLALAINEMFMKNETYKIIKENISKRVNDFSDEKIIQEWLRLLESE